MPITLNGIQLRRSRWHPWPLLAIALLAPQPAQLNAQPSSRPDTLTVRSGDLRLRALIWRPRGSGPFPPVLFNHGSYPPATDSLSLHECATVGPVFARHGYVLLFLFRQGVGLSANQGTAGLEQMERALAANGQAGRNAVQLQLLENEEMNEALAGLASLRAQPDVDGNRIAVAGHSFGGSLSLLMLGRDSTFRAALIFGGAANSWPKSPLLRARLIAVARRTSTPVFLAHAANDYSTTPGKVLAAEMKRLRKPHFLKIYPASGRTPQEGHNLLYRSPATWERDVFAFLDARLQHLRH